MLKFRKEAYIRNFLAILLCAYFLLSQYSMIYGAQLEVEYPKIGDQTLTVQSRLPDFAIYLFNAGVGIGFVSVLLSLIIAGVMYFLSPVKADLKADAKDRVSGAFSGLLILVLTYLIITTINPQLSIFKLNQLQELPPPEEEKPAPGIYLYSQSGCLDKNVSPILTSVQDLGNLKNNVNSIKLLQDYDNNTYYVSIIYDYPSFWGECHYLNPNSDDCQPVENFASSISVYKYALKPAGRGVFFFRKSCFNNEASNSLDNLIRKCKKDSGGYLEIAKGEIGPMYIKNLESLHFKNVPEDQKDCKEYDENEICVNREDPSLAGENISSILIDGDYLVLLSYAGPGESCESSINTGCQEFPIPDDINKIGPQQIKWENIRNSRGVVPNCVMIIPIEK